MRAGEIRIEKSHSLGLAEANKRVHGMEAPLQKKYGVKLDWQGDSARVYGKGVEGNVLVSDDHVLVDLKLGLLLRPIASKIKSVLEEQLDKALN